jgi:hyperosmotically inducible protein
MRVGGWRMRIPMVVALLVAAPYAPAQRSKDLSAVHARLQKEVRHELLTLPNYTMFDILRFEITGVDTVVLSGQVMQPSLKSDAESAVRRLEGVGKVVNRIEVLPLSPDDDRIRRAAFRAVYSAQGLERYALRSVPPIHIIVKNGTITLVGVVASQMDKDLAGIAARDVPGTFGVTNDLVVQGK